MKRIAISLFLVLVLIWVAYAERQMRILVYPFENQGPAEFSWLSASMTSSVIADLKKIRSVEVFTDADRIKIMQEIQFSLSDPADPKTAVQVGHLMGADTLFTGSYTVVNAKVRVVASLLNVETGGVLKSVKLDGTVDKIFDLQDNIVLELMAGAGDIRLAGTRQPVVTVEEKANLDKEPRVSVAAYKLYGQGLEKAAVDPAGALGLFKAALAMEPEYVEALLEAGLLAGNTMNRFDEGLAHLQRAQAILTKQNQIQTADYAVLMSDIGIVYASKNDLDYLDKALEYLGLSRDIYDRLGLQDTVDYANLMIKIGVTYRSKGEIDRALKYYDKCRDIYDRLGLKNTAGYAMLFMRIGAIYNLDHKPDKALESLDRSRDIYDSLGLKNTAGYANLIYEIAYAHMQKGEPGIALEYLGKARELYIRLGLQNTVDCGNLLLLTGMIYEITGDKNNAGVFYKQAYEAYVKAGYMGPDKDAAGAAVERLGH